MFVYVGFNSGKVYETTGSSSLAARTLVAPATNLLRTGVDTNAMDFQWTLSAEATKSRIQLENLIHELTEGKDTTTFTDLIGLNLYNLTVHVANKDQDYELVGISDSYTTLPLSPTGLTVKEFESYDSLTITWHAALGANTYEAIISVGGAYVQTIITESLNATFSQLNENVPYHYGVVGTGYQSTGRSIIQTISPDSIINLRCAVTQSSITYTRILR